jgi:hypothetical protein
MGRRLAADQIGQRQGEGGKFMRKALIAIAVATALFAIGAFAASFAVQSEDIASGTNPTTNCAASASVNFNEDFDEATNDWNVETITVTLVSATTCVGADAQLVLQDNDAGETIVLDQTKTIVAGDVSGSNVVLTYTPTATLKVADVWNSAILIDNLNIPIV